jgi:hypothetical protein
MVSYGNWDGYMKKVGGFTVVTHLPILQVWPGLSYRYIVSFRLNFILNVSSCIAVIIYMSILKEYIHVVMWMDLRRKFSPPFLVS